MSNTLLRTVLSTTAAITVAGLSTLALAYRETHKFEVKQVTVPLLEPGTFEDPEEESFHILHISDLHMLDRQKHKQKWVAALSDLDFDLVINTGDNLGEDKGVPGVLRALDPLLNRPGVFVFGSNDYFAPRPVNPFIYLLGKKRTPSKVELPWRGMRAAFVERGWHDATHQHVDFSIEPRHDSLYVRHHKFNVAIAGVDDPHHELDDFRRIAGGPNPDADIAIGLSHSPEPHVLDQFAAEGYQLVLSGHTHGGQLCLPGSRAIVTNCGLDRSRVQGLSRWSERMWLHVTNGLGNSKYVPFRIFCRPSATLIHIVERGQDVEIYENI
ncbi:metallophosphoesterase [Corynebacterium anserum]|uniref:Metallophosphoesterase n=1 Tax=Corynebacterium anserum TaxID=2684406 RepID=A0A7G7YQE8_9CORY|nr:metallophosphoesterase [Corynebacterium anserum]MBC2682404.1 metallophosphoesterase [Corynebacterium anserum]QNH96718.1 metallophosphoesterase [Corynebacterium anserum]